MATKFFQKEIGGKVRTWKFDFGTGEIVADLMKDDPINLLNGITDLPSINSAIKYFTYAALVRGCEVQGQAPDFTFDDVCRWLRDMENAPVGVVPAMVAVYNHTEALGGGEPDTRPGAADVA